MLRPLALLVLTALLPLAPASSLAPHSACGARPSEPAAPQSGHPKLAPYEGIRWTTPGSPPVTEILVEGTWYQLVQLDGLAAAKIYTFCETTWPGQAQKRFGEDLVEALTRMGHTVGTAVDLEVREIGSTRVLTLPAVEMTHANRQAVLARNKGRAAPTSTPTLPRIALPPVVDAPDERYAHLARLAPECAGPNVSVRDARADLVELEQAMQERFSYLTLTGVDRRAAFDALHHGLHSAGEDVPLRAFGLGVKQLLALFGDGHTRLAGLRELARPGYAPYLLQEAEGGVVAFGESRDSLLDPEHPFVKAIDGRPLEEWIAFATRYEALGSPQFQRRQAVRNLRYLAEIRAALEQPASDQVTLTLVNAAGEERELLETLRTDRAPAYGPWPRAESRPMENGVHYLRLGAMDDDPALMSELRGAMKEAHGGEGLVIDVRGNGGGTRDALKLLFPLLLGAPEPPVVVNIAAKRLEPGEPTDLARGYLDNRRLYPLDWDGWKPAERDALAATLESFAPDWTLPEGFSAWHGFVLSPAAKADPHRFDGKVVVLMDTGCFSATDIFIGALELLPHVTLVGTPSGGGSGRSRRVSLRRTQLDARLSSMASFRPAGARYDGRGIAPDLLVLPAPSDLVGDSDTQLEAALDVLRGRRR